jgi:hypothetical protein
VKQWHSLAIVILVTVSYLLGEALLGSPGGLATAGSVFVAFLGTIWALRKLSGMSWREAVWPRPEPPSWRRLPQDMESVQELARSGMTIQAIKLHRRITGADLPTSHAAIKAMAADRPPGT